MSSSQRRVLLAKPRGYCAGVDRAVQAVEMALDKFGPPVYVRRQIVHNTYVVGTLEKRGAIFVAEVDEVPPGAVVVFSAHGIAPEVRLDAERRGLHAIDATCPLVTKVHREAIGGSRPRATTSCSSATRDTKRWSARWARRRPGSAWCKARRRGDDRSRRTRERLAYPRRRRCRWTETVEIIAKLTSVSRTSLGPKKEDICYATQNRQAAVKVIATEADLVLVVGSPNSSNSVRLVEVAKDYGASAAYLVDDAGEVDERWLDGVTTVGVTSGASVPEELVTAVLDRLAEHGFGDVEEVEAVEEHMTFALPRELRTAGAAGPRQNG